MGSRLNRPAVIKGVSLSGICPQTSRRGGTGLSRSRLAVDPSRSHILNGCLCHRRVVGYGGYRYLKVSVSRPYLLCFVATVGRGVGCGEMPIGLPSNQTASQHLLVCLQTNRRWDALDTLAGPLRLRLLNCYMQCIHHRIKDALLHWLGI